MCYYTGAAPIEDGHEEKNSPGVAEPHSVRRKFNRVSRSVNVPLSANGESFGVMSLAWRFKVSCKLKGDGDVGSRRGVRVYSRQVLRVCWPNFSGAPTSRL